MTENERKRIPDLGSREAKGTTTMLFSVEDGGCEKFYHPKKSAETKKGRTSGQVQPSTEEQCQ